MLYNCYTTVNARHYCPITAQFTCSWFIHAVVVVRLNFITKFPSKLSGGRHLITGGRHLISGCNQVKGKHYHMKEKHYNAKEKRNVALINGLPYGSAALPVKYSLYSVTSQ